MEPVFKWNTGRRKEISSLLPYLPDYVKSSLMGDAVEYTYIDPFVGGGALYWYLNNSQFTSHPHNLINDWEEGMMDFYTSMQVQDPTFLKIINDAAGLYDKDFVASIGVSKASKLQSEMYYSLRNLDKIPGKIRSLTVGERGARFWIVNQLAYNGERRYNGRGEFNVGYNKAKTLNIKMLTDPEHINLLRNTVIVNNDYSVVMKNYEMIDRDGVFIFGDPPYTHAMKKNNATMDRLFTDSKQFEVGDYFKRLEKASWLVLIDDTPTTREVYDGFVKGSYYVKSIGARHLVATNYDVDFNNVPAYTGPYKSDG